MESRQTSGLRLCGQGNKKKAALRQCSTARVVPVYVAIRMEARDSVAPSMND